VYPCNWNVFAAVPKGKVMIVAVMFKTIHDAGGDIALTGNSAGNFFTSAGTHSAVFQDGRQFF